MASATAETAYNNATGLPADLYDDNGDVKGLEMLTYFLFFVGYISMGVAFVFFMSERNNVAPEYRTTMTISALIVGIAALHYYYMRGVYADFGVVSTEYRYMDWIITVPLMALLSSPRSSGRTPSRTRRSPSSVASRASASRARWS